MVKVKLLELLDGKWEDGTRPKDLFSLHVSKAPATHVADIVTGLGSDNRKVQGGSAELASLLSEDHPALLYPHIELFRKNLGAREPILRWEAVCTLGNLAKVDKDGVTPACVEAIIGLLRHKSIVLQSHAVKALAKIASAFPAEAPRIFSALVASKDAFPVNRIGFIVEAMSVFAGDKALAPKARAFIEPLARSEINSVATKARKALKALSAAK
jgi:hypothetical protein